MSGEERAASASQQRMKMEAQKEEANQKFLSQFTVLRLDGSEEFKKKAFDSAIAAIDQTVPLVEKTVASKIKADFDKDDPQAVWHCIVGKHFAASISYATKNSIFFQTRGLTILLFKSED